jgi:hypothetical protein
MHIDIDSGLVHLAAALGVQSCAVFGPSPAEYFGYPGNINIPPTFCGNCWWVNESWMDQCPLGFPDARCMLEQDPSDVANAIIARLAQNGVGRNVSSRTDSAATWDQDLPGTGAKLSHASLEHSDAARAIP